MEKNIRHGKCDLANDFCCVRVEVVSGRSVTSSASVDNSANLKNLAHFYSRR